MSEYGRLRKVETLRIEAVMTVEVMAESDLEALEEGMKMALARRGTDRAAWEAPKEDLLAVLPEKKEVFAPPAARERKEQS